MANSTLGVALNTLIAGYERRNQGIANSSDNDFIAGNDILKRGNELLRAAYQEFPVDSRPSPAVT